LTAKSAESWWTVGKVQEKEKGFSLIEIAFVMLLLALFGITTYSLVAVGASSYENMLIEEEDHANMRVALSYVSTRVRQGDAENAFRIEPIESGNALVISHTVDGEIYENWIYMRGNELCELYIPKELGFSPEGGTPLATIGGMELDMTPIGGGIIINVFSQYPDKFAKLGLFLQLRSDH
jgi:hypothetical protein